MSEQTPADDTRLTFQHLQEIDIGAAELVADVASWISEHQDLWRAAKHAGLEEVPEDALEAATVNSVGRKVRVALPAHHKV